MIKKYLVIPGYVSSATDKEFHYITASQLMNLYGVSPRECVVFNNERDKGVDKEWRNKTSALIKLVPRFDGNYKL